MSGRRARRCEVAKRAARVRLVVRLHTICPFVNVLVTYSLDYSIPPPKLRPDFGKRASQIGNCPTLASTSSGAPSATGLPQSAPPLRAPPPKCPHRESQLSQRQLGISRLSTLRKTTLARPSNPTRRAFGTAWYNRHERIDLHWMGLALEAASPPRGPRRGRGAVHSLLGASPFLPFVTFITPTTNSRRCPLPFKKGRRRGMPRLLHHISARYLAGRAM